MKNVSSVSRVEQIDVSQMHHKRGFGAKPLKYCNNIFAQYLGQSNRRHFVWRTILSFF